jgi:allantoin racemase
LIVNPNASAEVTRWLEGEARRVAKSRFEIGAVNAPSGVAAIETRDDLARNGSGRFDDRLREGRWGGHDRCLRRSEMAEARALVRIPVFGLGEEWLRAAAATGQRFSIVTLGEAMRAPIAARVRALGLDGQLQDIRILPVSVKDIIADRDAYRRAIANAIPSSPCAVLLGGAPFAGLGAQMAEETGAVVLDGVEAFVAAARTTFGRLS